MAQVGGMPKSGDLVMDLWEEWRSPLTRGVMAPWQEPFIQAATGGFLMRRPLKTQLLHSFRQNVEQFGVYACASSAGLCRGRRVGS